MGSAQSSSVSRTKRGPHTLCTYTLHPLEAVRVALTECKTAQLGVPGGSGWYPCMHACGAEIDKPSIERVPAMLLVIACSTFVAYFRRPSCAYAVGDIIHAAGLACWWMHGSRVFNFGSYIC